MFNPSEQNIQISRETVLTSKTSEPASFDQVQRMIESLSYAYIKGCSPKIKQSQKTEFKNDFSIISTTIWNSIA